MFFLTEIYSTKNLSKANQYQAYLKERGIRCTLKAQRLTGLQPLDAAKLGSLTIKQLEFLYRLYVRRKDADEALFLLRDYEQKG